MSNTSFDAVVVGGGLAGLYALHRLRGLGLKARVYEAGSGVGGTWFWNRYPGARCDIESLEYSYSFSDDLQQEWTWPERYGTQPEILRYINHVADRFDLRRDMQLEHAHRRRPSSTGRQPLDASTTDKGEVVTAPFCIMATGNLSTPRVPDFKGIERFKGKWYHTGLWPQEGVDFSGQRVGVIGTGSSGMQMIPLIAQPGEPPARLPAHGEFQPAGAQRAAGSGEGARAQGRLCRASRRAAYDTPSASPATRRRPSPRWRRTPEERERTYEAKWAEGGSISFLYSYTDLLVNKDANDTAVRVRAQEDPRHRQGSGGRRAAGAEGPSDRHQAPVPRYQLLRNLQPRQRHPGRRAHARRSRRSPRRGVRTRGRRNTSSTPSSSPPASTP